MPQKPDPLPELVLSTENDPNAARRIRRLASAGKLRKLYAGVYTSNLDSPPDAVVLRNWRAIAGHLLPGGVISHRSAFDGKPNGDSLIITRGKTRRNLELPGLTIEIMPGHGPLNAVAGDTPYGALFLAGDPRRFLENLTRGRGWSARVLPQEELEAALDRILMIGGENRLNRLRDQAREVARTLGYDVQFKRLDGLIGALLGSHASRKLTGKQALARAGGRPYDPRRLEIFDTLFAALNREVFPDVSDAAATGAARENFAFFEAYFSNYIEGTTFTVEEAENIVFHGQIIENRGADSHDVLGVFEAAMNAPWRDQSPRTAEDFQHWLRSVNALVLRKRPAKKPGEWKDKPNQAGNTWLVMSELVPGTLREGFERIRALTHPLARAAMTMFVVTEVHPFLDGNGRTARLIMNCMLSADRQCRIIIPTVYREDYLLSLKALSHNQNGEPLVAVLTRIQRWSAAFDYGQSRPDLRRILASCNAFQEDLMNYRLLFP